MVVIPINLYRLSLPTTRSQYPKNWKSSQSHILHPMPRRNPPDGQFSIVFYQG